jgi:hypothetical protein
MVYISCDKVLSYGCDIDTKDYKKITEKYIDEIDGEVFLIYYIDGVQYKKEMDYQENWNEDIESQYSDLDYETESEIDSDSDSEPKPAKPVSPKVKHLCQGWNAAGDLCKIDTNTNYCEKVGKWFCWRHIVDAEEFSAGKVEKSDVRRKIEQIANSLLNLKAS